MISLPKIAVVIPCYKVREQILDVLSLIDRDIVTKVFVVDDCCPDQSTDIISNHYDSDFVTILKNEKNLGVGGAVIQGYIAALADNMDIIVKIDGDGQMDPRIIMDFVYPILVGEADYTKGNRFFNLDTITKMPKLRLFGNAALSFFTKISSGYWNLFDPTNGYTAIHKDVLSELPFNKLSKRYFFESDILFRLNTLHAVVVDVPMDAKYEDETSNLKISQIIGEFFFKHMRNTLKRIFYNYYLRDMSIASIELPLGILSLTFGIIYGGINWISASNTDVSAPTGTIMLSALTTMIGLQFLLAFLSYDIASIPKRPRQQKNRDTIKLLKRS